MSKVALINPPSPFLMDPMVFPNLGLLHVATSLRREGIKADIIDLCAEDSPGTKISQIAKEYDTFGFSSTSSQFKITHHLNEFLKLHNPSAHTVLGGAHASAMSALRRARPERDQTNLNSLRNFDVVFEGEADADPLLMVHRNGQKWRTAKLLSKIEDSPIADRSLIDVKAYKYLLQNKPTTIILSQRGCPFKCEFCSGRDIEMYRRLRSATPQRVLEELDYLNKEFGFESFMWFDDEININPQRLKALCQELKKRPYIHRGFVRSDLLVRYPETLDSLVEAGFVELCSGVESGSDRILKDINKGTNSEVNYKAARMILDRGLGYKAFTIIGNPGETYEDIEKTKEWLKNVKPTSFDVSILHPYPGSRIYDLSTSSTKHKGYPWEFKGLYMRDTDFSASDSFYKGKPGEYPCNVRTDALSSEDLIRIRDDIESGLKK